MKKSIVVTVAILIVAVAAGGADLTLTPAAHDTDATRELKWDNGTVQTYLSYGSGPNIWLGVDFDISTIPSYNHLRTARINASPTPGSWNAFRLAIYSFTSTPGSILWGPQFIYGSTTGWNDFTVDWGLPGGTTKFLIGVEQYYNPPNNDSLGMDSNPTSTGHNWAYIFGYWERFNAPGGYDNIMFRAVMDNEHTGVAPQSLGRVKALYY